MPALRLHTAVPYSIDVHGRYIKRQWPQHQLVSDTRDADKVLWQHRQQIGVGNHPACGKELVYREHYLTFAAQRCERFVNKPKRPA